MYMGKCETTNIPFRKCRSLDGKVMLLRGHENCSGLKLITPDDLLYKEEEKFIMRSFMGCNLHRIFLAQLN